MAKIIRKCNHLEEELAELKYGTEEQQEAVEKTRSDGNKALVGGFVGFLLGVVLILAGSYVVGKTCAQVGVIVMLLSLLVLLVGFVASIWTFSPNRNRVAVVEAGIDGEDRTAEIIATLPDDYTGYRNIHIPYVNKSGEKSLVEFDMIVVGATGVTIVETKNYSGDITGNVEEKKLDRRRVSRYDVERFDRIDNPVKQVGFQFFVLKQFLQENGFTNCIDSAAYFPDESCTIELEGRTPVAVFAEGDDGEEKLRAYILSRNRRLTAHTVAQLNQLLKALPTPPRSQFK